MSQVRSTFAFLLLLTTYWEVIALEYPSESSRSIRIDENHNLCMEGERPVIPEVILNKDSGRRVLSKEPVVQKCETHGTMKPLTDWLQQQNACNHETCTVSITFVCVNFDTTYVMESIDRAQKRLCPTQSLIQIQPDVSHLKSEDTCLQLFGHIISEQTYQVVHEMCDGRQECNSSFFSKLPTGDPSCQDKQHRHSLALTYKCINTLPFQAQSSCSGNEPSSSLCEEDKIISVALVLFTEGCPLTGAINRGTFGGDQDLVDIQSICNGKTNCTLMPKLRYWGQYENQRQSHLTVFFQCVGSLWQVTDIVLIVVPVCASVLLFAIGVFCLCRNWKKIPSVSCRNCVFFIEPRRTIDSSVVSSSDLDNYSDPGQIVPQAEESTKDMEPEEMYESVTGDRYSVSPSKFETSQPLPQSSQQKSKRYDKKHQHKKKSNQPKTEEKTKSRHPKKSSIPENMNSNQSSQSQMCYDGEIPEDMYDEVAGTGQLSVQDGLRRVVQQSRMDENEPKSQRSGEKSLSSNKKENEALGNKGKTSTKYPKVSQSPVCLFPDDTQANSEGEIPEDMYDDVPGAQISIQDGLMKALQEQRQSKPKLAVKPVKPKGTHMHHHPQSQTKTLPDSIEFESTPPAASSIFIKSSGIPNPNTKPAVFKKPGHDSSECRPGISRSDQNRIRAQPSLNNQDNTKPPSTPRGPRHQWSSTRQHHPPSPASQHHSKQWSSTKSQHRPQRGRKEPSPISQRAFLLQSKMNSPGFPKRMNVQAQQAASTEEDMETIEAYDDLLY